MADNPVWAICERLAEVQALLDDHIAGGKAFDPRVVAALQARYIELEHLARSQAPEDRPKLSLDVRVQRGAAPDAGFAASVMPLSQSHSRPSLIDVLNRTEEPLSLDETLSAAALRLRHLVSFDALAIFVVHADVLVARFALGENVRHLSSLRIRNGQGLAGWVAEIGNYIINGNPKVEPGLEGSRSFALCSTLAVPLLNAGRTVGVLAVYGLQPDAFTSEPLNVLQASAHQLGDMIGEKLAAEQQRSSRSSDWRHRNSHARRNSAEETRSSLPSILTSAK